MKKIIFIISLFVMFMPFINAETTDLVKTGKSAVLIEASTGKVLFEKNKEEKLAPASTTKIMTMILTMEALDKGKIKLTDKVTISKNAASMGGSQIFISEGSNVSVDDLLKGVSIASANDAAVALAEKIGGSEENFVKMMNEKAKSMHLKNTHFENPHGLDAENHYTSAEDLAVMASYLVKYEKILKYSSTYDEYMKKSNGEKFWLVNTNKLIKTYKGMDGLKTGYTGKAGYCLVATAKKNNMRLISVILNASSTENRSEETVSLLEYGFNLYDATTVLKKNKKLGTINIPNSKKREVSYYAIDDIKIVSEKGKNNKYKITKSLNSVKAPLKKNDKVGTLTIKINDQKRNYDLIVKEDVIKSNYFNTLINTLKDLVSVKVSKW